ncbi:MAG TPA: hypothetical protein VFM18_07440, partial [Methanosarcina sp.]|nr:hypothetical protein [Methanosarcina sp.]
VSSPNNPKYAAQTLTVSNAGVLTLPDYYSYGYVGLPYITEIETLNLEASDNRTLLPVGKLINAAGVGVKKTIGGYMGQANAAIGDMQEFYTLASQNIEDPTAPFDGYLEMQYPAAWESLGRVNIKQVDPLPMSILAVYPKGIRGDGG